MRILVGNIHLATTGGTENYTYALATKLKEMGHEVEYFTFVKGLVSDKLEAAGIPYMSHDKYDLILANHHIVVDRLHKHGFTIQTCHGVLTPLEQPSPFAHRHVSISSEIKKHVAKKGYESSILLNGIDCERFYPQKPLHDKLTGVLSLCQSETANNFIKECCETLDPNIKFLRCNKYTDNVWEVEKKINEADLVIGIGRSLYDAMACGRCVMSFDIRENNLADNKATGDGYISAENIEQSIADNCIGRDRRIDFTKENFINELKKYNPKDGEWTRSYALENLNMKKSAQLYIDLYKETIQGKPNADNGNKATKKEITQEYSDLAFTSRKAIFKDRNYSTPVAREVLKSYLRMPEYKRKGNLLLKYLWYRILR